MLIYRSRGNRAQRRTGRLRKVMEWTAVRQVNSKWRLGTEQTCPELLNNRRNFILFQGDYVSSQLYKNVYKMDDSKRLAIKLGITTSFCKEIFWYRLIHFSNGEWYLWNVRSAFFLHCFFLPCEATVRKSLSIPTPAASPSLHVSGGPIISH